MATVIRTAMHHTAPAMPTLPTVMDTAPATVIPRTVMGTVMGTVLGMATDPTVLGTITPTTVIDPHIPTTALHTGTIVRGVGAVGSSRPSTAGPPADYCTLHL